MNIKACITILCFCCVLVNFTMHDSLADDSTQMSEMTFSEEELNDVYNGLPESVREHVDSLSGDERSQYLTIIKLDELDEIEREKHKQRLIIERAERESQRKAREDAANAQRYVLDPLLLEAWNYYSNGEDRRREKSVELFEEYLKKNPDSPFKAEVLFRLGTLYTTHRNEKYGESRNREKAIEYWSKAHDLYGNKFSYDHNALWASMANYSDDIEVKKEYYEWLILLNESNDADMIYPVRGIGSCINGSSPVLSESTRAGMLEWLKNENIEAVTNVAVANIIAMSSEQDLINLSNSYPNSSMGDIAKEKLDKYRSQRESFIGDLRTETTSASQENHNEVDVNSGLQNTTEESGPKTKSLKLYWLVFPIFTMFVIVLGIYNIRSRKTH